MYSIHKIKAAAATLMVGFLLAVAFAATAQAGNGTRFGMTAQEWKAEQVRGDALNRTYHLGAYTPAAEARKADKIRGQELNRRYHLGQYAQSGSNTRFGMTAQEWKAEQVRGDALNRTYHLGAYSPAAEARKADKIRGQELNRRYHLGQYAVIETSSTFQWNDAGIGAAAMLGTILVAGGLAVLTLRRRGGVKPSVPRST
jgi:hypothetical protein